MWILGKVIHLYLKYVKINIFLLLFTEVLFNRINYNSVMYTSGRPIAPYHTLKLTYFTICFRKCFLAMGCSTKFLSIVKPISLEHQFKFISSAYCTCNCTIVIYDTVHLSVKRIKPKFYFQLIISKCMCTCKSLLILLPNCRYHNISTLSCWFPKFVLLLY